MAYCGCDSTGILAKVVGTSETWTGTTAPRQLYKKWNLYGVFQKWRQENGLPKKGWQRDDHDDQLLSRCTSFPQGTRDGTMLPVRNAGSFACRRMLRRWRKKLQQICWVWRIRFMESQPIGQKPSKNVGTQKNICWGHIPPQVRWQIGPFQPQCFAMLRNLRRNCWSGCAGGTFWCFSMYNSSLKLQLMGGCNWSQCPPRIDLTLQ